MQPKKQTAPPSAKGGAANVGAQDSASRKIGEGAQLIKLPLPRLSARRWGAIRLAELKRLALWRRSQGHAMLAEPWAFVLTASLAVADPGKIPVRSKRQPFVAWSGLTEESAEAAMQACGFTEGDFEEIDVARAIEAARRWQVLRPGHRLSSAKCGEAVSVSSVERDNLDLRTIDAIDEPRGVRRARKAEEKRQRDREAARAKRGRVPRDLWLASRLTASKPWEAESISRRTWERRRARVAGVSSHLIEISSSGDTPATAPQPSGDTPVSTPSPCGDARGSAPQPPGHGVIDPLDPNAAGPLRRPSSPAPRQSEDRCAASRSPFFSISQNPKPVRPAPQEEEPSMSSTVPPRVKSRLLIANLPQSRRPLLISVLEKRPRPVLVSRLANDLSPAA